MSINTTLPNGDIAYEYFNALEQSVSAHDRLIAAIGFKSLALEADSKDAHTYLYRAETNLKAIAECPRPDNDYPTQPEVLGAIDLNCMPLTKELILHKRLGDLALVKECRTNFIKDLSQQAKRSKKLLFSNPPTDPLLKTQYSSLAASFNAGAVGGLLADFELTLLKNNDWMGLCSFFDLSALRATKNGEPITPRLLHAKIFTQLGIGDQVQQTYDVYVRSFKESIHDRHDESTSLIWLQDDLKVPPEKAVSPLTIISELAQNKSSKFKTALRIRKLLHKIDTRTFAAFTSSR